MGVVFVYDPAADEWTKEEPDAARVHHAMTAVHNGKVYVFGGFSRPGKELAWQPVDNAWEYTPESDTWKALAPLPSSAVRAEQLSLTASCMRSAAHRSCRDRAIRRSASMDSSAIRP